MSSILVISDSFIGGSFDISADVRTIEGHGMNAFTAIPVRIDESGNRQSCDIASLLEDFLSSNTPDAIKTGIFSDAYSVKAIVNSLLKHDLKRPVVVNPCIISDSGEVMVTEEVFKAITEHLLPLATVITPNLFEAELMSGFPIRAQYDVLRAAKKISALYNNAAVLVRGGAVSKNADLSLQDNNISWIAPVKPKQNFDFSRCSLSSAIACKFVEHATLDDAVRHAKHFINGYIAFKQAPELKKVESNKVVLAPMSELKKEAEIKSRGFIKAISEEENASIVSKESEVIETKVAPETAASAVSVGLRELASSVNVIRPASATATVAASTPVIAVAQTTVSSVPVAHVTVTPTQRPGSLSSLVKDNSPLRGLSELSEMRKHLTMLGSRDVIPGVSDVKITETKTVDSKSVEETAEVEQPTQYYSHIGSIDMSSDSVPDVVSVETKDRETGKLTEFYDVEESPSASIKRIAGSFALDFPSSDVAKNSAPSQEVRSSVDKTVTSVSQSDFDERIRNLKNKLQSISMKS